MDSGRAEMSSPPRHEQPTASCVCVWGGGGARGSELLPTPPCFMVQSMKQSDAIDPALARHTGSAVNRRVLGTEQLLCCCCTYNFVAAAAAAITLLCAQAIGPVAKCLDPLEHAMRASCTQVLLPASGRMPTASCLNDEGWAMLLWMVLSCASSTRDHSTPHVLVQLLFPMPIPCLNAGH